METPVATACKRQRLLALRRQPAPLPWREPASDRPLRVASTRTAALNYWRGGKDSAWPRLNLISEQTLNTQLGSTVRQRVRRNGRSRLAARIAKRAPYGVVVARRSIAVLQSVRKLVDLCSSKDASIVKRPNRNQSVSPKSFSLPLNYSPVLARGRGGNADSAQPEQPSM
jgi:hypothetical protein